MTSASFRPVGDTGLLADFGEPADEATWQRVMALDRALADAPPAGMIEVVPAYTSLLLVFDPTLTDHQALAAAVEHIGVASGSSPRATHDVIVDYRAGADLPEVAARLGLTVAEVAALHAGAGYRVAMYGFAPGYAYLAGVPDALHLPRKPAAVRGVPVGSIIIAGGQCLITTLPMPTGWWVIGHTDACILDAQGPRPFLFDPGDQVRFTAAAP